MRVSRGGLNEGNGRDGLRIGPLHDFLLAVRAANEAIADHDARQQNRSRGGGQEAPPTWSFDVFRGHFVLRSMRRCGRSACLICIVTLSAVDQTEYGGHQK